MILNGESGQVGVSIWNDHRSPALILTANSSTSSSSANWFSLSWSARPESERMWLHAKRFPFRNGRCGQPAPQAFVDDLFHRQVLPRHPGFDPSLDVGIDGDRCPHIDIICQRKLMFRHHDWACRLHGSSRPGRLPYNEVCGRCRNRFASAGGATELFPPDGSSRGAPPGGGAAAEKSGQRRNCKPLGGV